MKLREMICLGVQGSFYSDVLCSSALTLSLGLQTLSHFIKLLSFISNNTDREIEENMENVTHLLNIHKINYFKISVFKIYIYF